MSTVNQTAIEIKFSEKKTSLLSNYIIRDVVLWLVFIFILPIILFIIYIFNKESIENNLPENDLINEPMSQVILNKYPNSICNDGSSANYYVRLSQSSKIWIIVIEGGYFCYDKTSCSQRRINSYNLTSSTHNKQFKFGSGFLSTNPKENKYFSNENLVNIPYCSSDLWTGSKRCKNCTEDFNFMGAEILNDVLDDLLSKTEIKKSNLVLISGVSAGGIGLLMNINKIKKKFNSNAPDVKLKVVIDSSWQLDFPYSYLCKESECLMDRIFMNSIDYWNTQIPVECMQEEKKIWNCFLPNKIMKFIDIPVLMVQSKFDESQIFEQFNQIEEHNKNKISIVETLKLMDLKFKKNLNKIHSYFITSCMNHILLIRNDWNQFKINNLSLQDVLYEWITNEKFELKLVDKCLWPDCFENCPPIRHPDTNKIITPLDYFSYLGLVNYKKLIHYSKLAETYFKKLSYNKLMKILMN